MTQYKKSLLLSGLVMSALAAFLVAPGCKDANYGNLIQAGGLLIQAETLNEEDEHQMGRSVTVAVTNQYRLYDNKPLSDYVTMVGLTVATASPRPDYNYVFGVLDTDEVGAYSGPSGYVMVTRGMISHMRDEAELAGVLAHECAHVARQHGLKAVKDPGFFPVALSLLLILSGTDTIPSIPPTYQTSLPQLGPSYFARR